MQHSIATFEQLSSRCPLYLLLHFILQKDAASIGADNRLFTI